MAHAIEVAGLTKRFGPVLAVDDLSFTVDEGRIVGFLGPNGAGKTTTLRMLLGLVNPTAGHATVLGQPVSPRWTTRARTRGRGAGRRDAPSRPQRAQPPARAGHGRRDRRRRASTSCCELVALSDAANRRAGGYSLGMRQRLGLAAALLGDPRVLVLDEPANGLDPQGIRWLRDFLRTLAAEGRAILVSSHVLAEVSQTADDVVVINKGRCVAQAPLTEHDRPQRRRDEGRRPGRAAGSGDILRAAGRDGQRRRREIIVRDRSGEQIGRRDRRAPARDLRAHARRLLAGGRLLRAHRTEATGGPS